MSTVLKFRRGDTTAANAFTGAEGELFVDTTKDTLVVHDGVTAGGKPLATESYVTTQISNLIDAAPTALDTLNELAAALGDDANYASTITTALAGKQATLSSGVNIKTVGGTSLLGSGNIALFSGAYADLTGKPTIPTAVSQLSNDTGFITTSSLTWSNITSKPSFATVATSGSYNDLSSTPTFKTINGNSILGSGDITISGGSGGIALTDLSVSLLVGPGAGSLSYDNTNGVFTYTPPDLSTKQDILVSGTDIKTINGQSLLGAGNITISGGSGGSPLTYGQFTDAEVDLTTTAADQVIDSYPLASYRTSKYIVQAVCDQVGIHSTEVMVMHDGVTVYITEYATMYTNGSLFTVNASISGTDVNVTVTPANANTLFDVVRTSLAARTFTAPSGLQGDLMSLSGSEDLQTATGSEDLNA